METPEDVAVLYSWANLHGAKYRDFSASRREYRAQMRHRAAEQEAEVETAGKAVDAEAAEKRKAAELEITEGERGASCRDRIIGAPCRGRCPVAAKLYAAALAEAQEKLQRAEREVLAARDAAIAEEALYAERQRRAQYSKEHPAEFRVNITDPYVKPEHDSFHMEHEMHRPGPQYVDTRPFPQHHMVLHPSPAPTDDLVMHQHDNAPPLHTHVVPETIPYRAPASQRVELQPEYPVFHPAAQAPPPGQAAYQAQRPQPVEPATRWVPIRTPTSAWDAARLIVRRSSVRRPAITQTSRRSAARCRRYGCRRSRLPQTYILIQDRFEYPQQPQQAGNVALIIRRRSRHRDPAWLYADHDAAAAGNAPAAPSPLADTLQHSRERVASRWFALKGVFDSSQEQQETQPVRQKEARTPALALFSLAGGVGKTSMVATLGRALASLGEKVLLTDTTSYGLLPFYFGARELRPGVVRTFSPPSGSTDAPIYLVNYEVDKPGEQNPEWLSDEIIRNSRGTNRILLDLGTGSASLTRRIAKLNPTILVPVAPDMNSVIGLANVEKYFAGQTDQDGRPIQPMYLLNQFDASLPLHLDVREVMRQQLGDRLLPFVIRRSPSVSEALAEGMTVMDYAPGSPVAEDYMNLAGWLRSLSAPAAQAFRGIRWSER